MESVTFFSVTETMIQPLVNAINSGLETMIPIGIGIMGSFLGINIVKRVIYSFF